MTGGFSFSPLYDKGLRSYIMATFDISPKLSGSVRFSNTYYFNKDIIGSGYDAIDASGRNDIKVRLSYRM
jgi:hypothetical protein